MLLKYSIVCGLIIAAFLATEILSAEQIMGVVYARGEGISAKGTGNVSLHTAQGMRYLTYVKPLPLSATLPGCQDIGATWEVSATLEDKDSGQLSSAICRPSLKPRISAAWRTVGIFLNLLADGNDVSARNLLLDKRQLDYRLNLTKATLTDYERFGRRGGCLEVVAEEADGVVIHTGPECYVDPPVRFLVAERRGVSRIERITLDANR